MNAANSAQHLVALGSPVIALRLRSIPFEIDDVALDCPLVALRLPSIPFEFSDVAFDCPLIALRLPSIPFEFAMLPSIALNPL